MMKEEIKFWRTLCEKGFIVCPHIIEKETYTIHKDTYYVQKVITQADGRIAIRDIPEGVIDTTAFNLRADIIPSLSYKEAIAKVKELIDWKDVIEEVAEQAELPSFEAFVIVNVGLGAEHHSLGIVEGLPDKCEEIAEELAQKFFDNDPALVNKKWEGINLRPQSG